MFENDPKSVFENDPPPLLKGQPKRTPQSRFRGRSLLSASGYQGGRIRLHPGDRLVRHRLAHGERGRCHSGQQQGGTAGASFECQPLGAAWGLYVLARGSNSPKNFESTPFRPVSKNNMA